MAQELCFWRAASTSTSTGSSACALMNGRSDRFFLHHRWCWNIDLHKNSFLSSKCRDIFQDHGASGIDMGRTLRKKCWSNPMGLDKTIPCSGQTFGALIAVSFFGEKLCIITYILSSCVFVYLLCVSSFHWICTYLPSGHFTSPCKSTIFNIHQKANHS